MLASLLGQHLALMNQLPPSEPIKQSRRPVASYVTMCQLVDTTAVINVSGRFRQPSSLH